jgi:glutamine synthetase
VPSRTALRTDPALFDGLGSQPMGPQLEYVLRTVEERGVRFVQLWFTDVLGSLKGFAVTPADLEGALEEGMSFDGSAIEGYSRVQESDMLAVPDPSTFEIVPWRGDAAPVARMFCDIQRLDGEPFVGDPRFVLRRGLDRLREHGYTFFAGPEIEYFYFKSASEPIPLDNAGFFDLTHTDTANELRRRTILNLEAMGIPVEYSFHENGPSQHEIDLRYTDALSMADNVMTFRMVVRRIASELGVHATFMPKPIAGAFGSGFHAHLSLFQGDVNAFHDGGDDSGLSKTGRHFVAGLLRHAREITAITNQTVNSYKRLIAGYEAPTYISWARNNESALVRVPHPKRDNESSTRVEFRSPDPACNPYLAFALMLAAGMKGVEQEYELPPEATNNIFEMTPAARRDAGIDLLPQSLAEALDVMEGSDLVRDTLGEHVFDFFIRNKRREWDSYKEQVTPWELERYLESL